jgi:uncharacterized integral membrane protein
MGYAFVVLVAVAVAIFAMQNTATVTVQFIIWKIEQVPLAAVVLSSLAAGAIIVGLPLYFQLWRARRNVRAQGPPHPGDRYDDQPPPLL